MRLCLSLQVFPFGFSVRVVNLSFNIFMDAQSTKVCNESTSMSVYVFLQVYKLPADRMYATYFGGDEKLGLAEDTEARDIWRGLLPQSHVLPFGCKVINR